MSTMDFVRGVSLGIVAGGAIGMCMRNDKRRSRKMRGKAVKTIGNIMDNVSDAFGG